MLKEIDYKKFIKSLVLISLGCALYAFAITNIIIPSKMAEGGGTGIALLIYYITGLQTSIGMLIVNIPLFILGYKLIDKKVMLFTLYGISMLTFWIGFFEQNQILIDLEGDRLLAALFGGIMAGVGLAIVFLNGGSTGGISILAIIIKKYYNIPIGRVIYILDAIIIFGTFLVIREFPPILYTLIQVYVLTKILDHLLEGGIPGKAVMIISPNIEEISQEISDSMERGMTFLKGEGYYSRKDINIGYCVVSVKEIKDIKEIIYKIDKEAFVTINNVQDIMGEGFSFKPKGR